MQVHVKKDDQRLFAAQPAFDLLAIASFLKLDSGFGTSCPFSLRYSVSGTWSSRAMPMSACLRAGASLTPSPVIATISPSCFRILGFRLGFRQKTLKLMSHPQTSFCVRYAAASRSDAGHKRGHCKHFYGPRMLHSSNCCGHGASRSSAEPENWPLLIAQTANNRNVAALVSAACVSALSWKIRLLRHLSAP